MLTDHPACIQSQSIYVHTLGLHAQKSQQMFYPHLTVLIIQGVPKKTEFQKFSDFQILLLFLGHLNNSGPLGPYWVPSAILGPLGYFGPFWALWAILGPLGHFGPSGLFWAILGPLGHFGPFWVTFLKDYKQYCTEINWAAELTCADNISWC